MDDTNTIYMLNDGCIAGSLCADHGNKQRFAVPHLSVLQSVNDGLVDAISGVSSFLSDAIDDINTDISAVISAVAVTPEDFSEAYASHRICFKYDGETQRLLLGNKSDYDHDKSNMLTVDCTDFIKDGMVSAVEVVDVDPHQTTKPGPFLKITWNTDAGGTETYICVRDMVGGLYGGISPIRVDNLSISLDEAALRGILGYDDLYAYYQFLAGLSSPADIGEIARLSGGVAALSAWVDRNFSEDQHSLSARKGVVASYGLTADGVSANISRSDWVVANKTAFSSMQASRAVVDSLSAGAVSVDMDALSLVNGDKVSSAKEISAAFREDINRNAANASTAYNESQEARREAAEAAEAAHAVAELATNAMNVAGSAVQTADNALLSAVHSVVVAENANVRSDVAEDLASQASFIAAQAE